MEKVVYQEKFVDVERVKEVPLYNEKVVTVEKIVEVPIEVVKIQEVIKEVEKIVYQNNGGGGGAESDCDCLTGVRFLNVWNQIFQLSGPVGTECLTEEEFVNTISRSLKKNCNNLSDDPRSDVRSTMDSTMLHSMSTATGFPAEKK